VVEPSGSARKSCRLPGEKEISYCIFTVFTETHKNIVQKNANCACYVDPTWLALCTLNCIDIVWFVMLWEVILCKLCV